MATATTMLGSRHRRLLGLGALAALTLALAACSPESARIRGGGAGADPGNHPADAADVQLQGDEPYFDRTYYETPREPLQPTGTEAE